MSGALGGFQGYPTGMPGGLIVARQLDGPQNEIVIDIPQTFNEVWGALALRTNYGSAYDVLKWYVNDDKTSGNYTRFRLSAVDPTTVSGAVTDTGLDSFDLNVAGSVSSVELFNNIEFRIPFYRHQGMRRVIHVRNLLYPSSSGQQYDLHALQWEKSEPVRRITLRPRDGTAFVQNSAWYLYGC